MGTRPAAAACVNHAVPAATCGPQTSGARLHAAAPHLWLPPSLPLLPALNSELYRDLGDLGDAAQALKQRQAVLQRPPPLTLAGVFGALQQLAREKGAGGCGRGAGASLACLRLRRLAAGGLEGRAEQEAPHSPFLFLAQAPRSGASAWCWACCAPAASARPDTSYEHWCRCARPAAPSLPLAGLPRRHAGQWRAPRRAGVPR